jgi:hypothetical protein
MKNDEKKNDGIAAVAEVKAEEPKATTTTTEAPVKNRKTPPGERRYELIKSPTERPKGLQRKIVLEILENAKAENKGPMTSKEVAKLAGQMGLVAAAGVEPSCGYHLHQLELLGFAKVFNPTIVEEPAAKAA